MGPVPRRVQITAGKGSPNGERVWRTFRLRPRSPPPARLPLAYRPSPLRNAHKGARTHTACRAAMFESPTPHKVRRCHNLDSWGRAGSHSSEGHEAGPLDTSGGMWFRATHDHVRWKETGSQITRLCGSRMPAPIGKRNSAGRRRRAGWWSRESRSAVARGSANPRSGNLPLTYFGTSSALEGTL